MPDEAAMWWYEQHKDALAGLRRLTGIPAQQNEISQTYLWLTRLTKPERPEFKELAGRLAGYYAFGTVPWKKRAIAEMKRQFNLYLEGMNIGVSAAATLKVQRLIELFGLEKIIHQVGSRQIVMALKQQTG